MNSLVRQFSLGAVALAMVQVANAQVNITNIAPVAVADGTEIRVMFNGLPPQPQAYQLNQPTRLLLDFPQVGQTVGKKQIPVTGNEVSAVDLETDAQRSRLTVNIKSAAGFTSRVEGNTFILKINNAKAQQAQVAKQAAVPKMGVANINFQKGTGKNEGVVVVDLLAAKTPLDVQQQGSKVVIRTRGSKIPSQLVRRLNTAEFATPVTAIDAYNDGSNGVITIQTEGGYDFTSYQSDKRLTLNFKRPVEQVFKAPTPTYTGKKISLQFQDIGVREVLQLLGDFTGTNIVAADNVQGNITLNLRDVPADQALDVILKTKNLDKRRTGNVIWVAPAADLIKAEKEEADAIAQGIKLAPIQTEYMRLSYAKASVIGKFLDDARQEARKYANGGNSDTTIGNSLSLDSLLSARGSAVADDRTNTLVINDTAKNLDKIRKMIELLDVPVKQVMVEARVVRATTDFSKELGVSWGILGNRDNGRFKVGGSQTTLWDLRTPTTNSTGGVTYTIQRPSNLNVDLGVTTTGAAKIAFGLLNLSDFMLDLELSALQADGRGEVISTPKVLTADKQKATIKTGQEIPYQTVSSSGGQTTVTTEFKEAVLQLDVTPSITPEGKVQMQLNVTNDSLAGYANNGEAILNKNEVNTNVLVNDGETVVLGGVFEQINQNQVNKVPLLGDLPAVGRLFRQDVKKENKRELLIFVTPRIINDNSLRN
ncbi:type IV pilus secretin PilQ [Moraxella sp. ZY210820]|uniref:type IV pilus secretin PilQ n=1 Tax=unclassified Moraxella TaxID=2685852 RepID=UPI00273188F1|nr:type IV pilus secretin PilQ [Moraxella sp. ZY210820]WLF84127.1 type IV pilus secretin PilQ [Moraxella sp. ZY210820]